MGYNCLIVDDSKVTRKIIAKALRLSGISLGEVYEAGNGQEALKIIDATAIHLVLADLNMPVMDGVAMIEAMARKGLMKTIPVVVVTSDRSAAIHHELSAKGVRAFLSKPFTPERIRAIALEILGGNPPGPAGTQASTDKDGERRA